MKADVVLCGVGGQGVLTVAGVLAEAARREGFHVRGGEIHGMSQRGGAVHASLRISDEATPAPQIPRGGAHLILAMEPLEALRYLEWLRPDGVVVSAEDPLDDIPGYPDLAELHARIRSLPRAFLVPAARIARDAGSVRAANMVVAGAALPFLPLTPAGVEAVVREAFATRSERVIEANVQALAVGAELTGAGPTVS
jgi:indolepyruvate ferredoxin oxidoreductase beta subunit